jgi:hypothetical protein
MTFSFLLVGTNTLTRTGGVPVFFFLPHRVNFSPARFYRRGHSQELDWICYIITHSEKKVCTDFTKTLFSSFQA